MKRKVIPNNEIHNVKLILLIPFDFSPNYPGKTIPIVGRAIAQNRSKKREGEKNGGFLLFRSIPSIDSPARPLITEGESSAVTIIRGSLSANWRARRFRGGCTFFELESRLIAPSCKLDTGTRVCRSRGRIRHRRFHWRLFTSHFLKIDESFASSVSSVTFSSWRRFQTSSSRKKFSDRDREGKFCIFN